MEKQGEKQAEEVREEKEEKITINKKEYEELINKSQLAADYKDKWLRTAAEFENSKKRWLKERQDIIDFANEELLRELLVVLDNLENALLNLREADTKILEGIELIYRDMKKVMEKFGLREVKEKKGDDFNPHFHEAVMHLEDEEIPEGKIIEVIRKGYLLKDRLLRAALVKVSKGKKEVVDDGKGGGN